MLMMLLIKNFHADDDDNGSAYGGGGGLYPPPPIVAPYVGNLCIIVCRHMYMLNARIFTSARVCRHSVHISVLFTFECIFHVVGQFGENCFFKEQSEMFLQIRDWHDALQCFSVHIIYLTLPVYFIPTKQSTSIKYNLYTNRKFTHT